MSLSAYNKKRKFENTPEPEEGKAKGKKLIFVIQKHDATQLHYDFRLEMDGVLKSWAVPKGPSTNPSDKRLAMMVEDHPYDYKDFEGIIPKGNYGAGTVIVWDQGTYEPIDGGKGKAAQDRLMQQQLENGSIKIRLDGEKLKGEFALVKTKGMAENAWLLIKHKDEFAEKKDVLLLDTSVQSGKKLEELSKQSQKQEKRKTSKSGKIKEEIKKQTQTEKPKENIESSISISGLLKKGKKEKMPNALSPMLATLVEDSFDDHDWEFEVKWDGYRMLAFLNKGEVKMMSRNNKPYDETYFPIFEILKEWNQNALIDGELVVVDEQGIASFQALQHWRSEADGRLIYYMFDLLWYEGKSLMDLPLSERKAILESIIPENDSLRIGFSVSGKGIEFFESAKQLGLEGIIAKKSDSRYFPGSRSKNWLKIKVDNQQEVIIIGYTKNEDSPRLFSSLLLGIYEEKKLVYCGKVGTGFKEREQKELFELFQSLIVKNSPVKESVDYNKSSKFRPNPPKTKVTWLKPQLVCVIKYTEITESGVFRHPSFLSLRIDKDAQEVVREIEVPTETVNPAADIIQQKASVEKNNSKKSKNKTEKPVVTEKLLLNAKDKNQVKKVNGKELKFTNLNKVFWQEEGITKRDLLNYYDQVAPFILPYLKNRPQSLNRFPNGIDGKSFYQKNISGRAPSWLKKMPYTSSENEKEKKQFLVAYDKASLLYMANLGAIEMNPWSSTINKPDHPDWCILDLDPGEKSTFEDVIQTAQVIKDILDELGIIGCPKTSGSTGMHIYIPLNAKYTYEQSRIFANWIAVETQKRLSEITSVERIIKAREGKLYIDFLQNRSQATLAAPYSVRPKPGATVSMPLYWEEVKKGLQIKDFTISNSLARLKNEGDIFKAVLGKGIDLKKILKELE